jgi:hypothetical protein
MTTTGENSYSKFEWSISFRSSIEPKELEASSITEDPIYWDSNLIVAFITHCRSVSMKSMETNNHTIAFCYNLSNSILTLFDIELHLDKNNSQGSKSLELVLDPPFACDAASH